jgi:hypothetical protein
MIHLAGTAEREHRVAEQLDAGQRDEVGTALGEHVRDVLAASSP